MQETKSSLQIAREAYYQANNAQAEAVANSSGQPWNPELVQFLVVAILLFGLLVIAMMCFLFIKEKGTEHVLVSFGIPLIIVAAVVLVVTGYYKEQIAPVIGLLGTIAGYLLGREGGAAKRSQT